MTRKEDNYIDVNCGNGKECFAQVKLCKSSFDFKSRDAWNSFNSFDDCPVMYATIATKTEEYGLEFHKISASGTRLTGFASRTQYPELFGAEGGEIWSSGQLVVCQIGGEHSEAISAQ